MFSLNICYLSALVEVSVLAGNASGCWQICSRWARRQTQFHQWTIEYAACWKWRGEALSNCIHIVYLLCLSSTLFIAFDMLAQVRVSNGIYGFDWKWTEMVFKEPLKQRCCLRRTNDAWSFDACAEDQSPKHRAMWLKSLLVLIIFYTIRYYQRIGCRVLHRSW